MSSMYEFKGWILVVSGFNYFKGGHMLKSDNSLFSDTCLFYPRQYHDKCYKISGKLECRQYFAVLLYF